MDFHGIFPPLTTPFAADGSLALDRLRESVGRYNATRLAGYAVAGSTGEAVLLSRDEIERVWDAVREAAAPGKILIEHFERVADAARIPVLLYSVPQFTGVALEAPAVARLAAHPNIIGIKESSGNVQRVGEIIQAAQPGFQTLVGSAGTFYPSLAVGAIGGILGLACVLPELCIELYELARAGESARALALQ